MNVSSMMNEILLIAYPMICETSLPYFGFSSNDGAERMRVSAFDELDGFFECHIRRGSQQEMNMLWH
jgi:hypothetical protein